MEKQESPNAIVFPVGGATHVDQLVLVEQPYEARFLGSMLYGRSSERVSR
jgi:hypothetical protein